MSAIGVATFVACLAAWFVGAMVLPLSAAELHVTFEKGVAVGASYFGPPDALAEAIERKERQTSLKDVTWISLVGPSMTADGVSALSAMENLEQVQMGAHPDAVRLQKGTIAAFKKIKKLVSLEIYGERQGKEFDLGPEIEELASVPHLEVLTIYRVIRTTSELDAVGKLKGLMWLRLDCEQKINRCDWLAKLEQLEDLCISAPEIDKSLIDAVSKMRNLRRLDVYGVKMDGHDMQTLSSRVGKTLESLETQLSPQCSLKELTTFPHLKHLSLRCDEGGETKGEFLEELPKLETVWLEGWVPGGDIEPLLIKHPALTLFVVRGELGGTIRFNWYRPPKDTADR